jgi:hypothetical protein
VSGGSPRFNPYWNDPPKKPERKPREEFMFGTEPLTGYRLWGVQTLAEKADQATTFTTYARLMAEALRERPENPWQYLLDGVRLTAIATSWTWSPIPVEGTCPRHPAPDLQCECGYWALRDKQQLEEAFVSYQPAAYGTVKLWGRFVEFEKGYRAQYAHPESVTLLREDLALADRLSRTYGCTVTIGEEPPGVAKLREKKAEEEAWGHGSLSASYTQLMQQHRHQMLAPPPFGFPDPPKKKFWKRP